MTDRLGLWMDGFGVGRLLMRPGARTVGNRFVGGSLPDAPQVRPRRTVRKAGPYRRTVDGVCRGDH